MTNKTLKIIAGFALVMSLATPSLAAVSTVTLTAAELAAPSIIKSGVSYLLPASATANVPSVGTATATGFSRTMLARVGPTAAIITAGTIGYAAFRTHVETHPNDYPTMYPLMFPGLSYPSTIDNNVVVGNVINVNGTQYQVVSKVTYAFEGCTMSASGWHQIGASYYTITGPTGPSYLCPSGYTNYATGSTRTFYNVSTTITQPPPLNDSQLQQAIQTPSLDQLYDIDKFISTNPDSVQVPSTLSTDIANATKQVAADTQKQASAARVASLKEVRDARQAAYDANPTPENKEALDKAEAEYQEALADDAELTAESIKDAEADSPLTPPEPPEYDTINFQPLVDMGEELGDKFPFSLLATLKNFATGLVTTPRAPAFDITFPAPFNHTWHVSLDRFDGIAQMVRVLIGMAFLGYCTMAIIRRWQ